MYIILFLFLIFSDCFEANVPMMNYWDELAAFLVVCWGGYDLWRSRKMDREELVSWIFLGLLVVIGALGNLCHPGLQTSYAAIIKDVVALCKFPAVFLVLQRRNGSSEKQEKHL